MNGTEQDAALKTVIGIIINKNNEKQITKKKTTRNKFKYLHGGPNQLEYHIAYH